MVNHASPEVASTLSRSTAISDSKRSVAFYSRSTNLAPDPEDAEEGNQDVYDRCTAEARQASRAEWFTLPHGSGPSISADGRYVFYHGPTNAIAKRYWQPATDAGSALLPPS